MKCVVCGREVADSSNWLKIHLWAGFAVVHWSCFAEFFKHGDGAKPENPYGAPNTINEVGRWQYYVS